MMRGGGRKRLLAAALALSLCAGCGFSGEYYSETPHVSSTETESRFNFNDGAGNYYALQSAVLSMISAGRESNTIPVSNYEGSLEEDLARITQEITTQNPLGCFAVASLVFDQTRVLTYQELSITIQYKRTPQEIASVREAPSRQDFERRLSELLSGFGKQGFYSVTALEDSQEDLYDRLYKCWYALADTAYGLKSVNITTYPDSGPKRIVEVHVDWTDERDTLIRQSKEAEARATEICKDFAGDTTYERLSFVESYISENIQYDDKAMRVVTETGGAQPRTSTYTAYGALVEGRAAQSGIAHAAKLLLDRLGMTSSLIAGTNAGVSYVWLWVQSDGVWYHYDPTGNHGLMSDEQLKQFGYEYNTAVYNLAAK